MHFNDASPSLQPDSGSESAWWKGLTRYQWFVFIVASLGWLFDTMDQQLFNLARQPAITELVGATPGDPATAGKVAEAAGMATTIFIVGWAIGGLIFGILGDRIGRVKTMMITILLYSAFTGLSALSRGVWDFAAYRFLTGLGVGGEFAVGVTLVAEVMSDRARPHALGWLQALSAIGNVGAAILSLGMTRLEETGAIGSYWRGMFLIGIVPALLTIPIFLRVREPEKWNAAAARRNAARDGGLPDSSPQLGSLRDLFGDPRWRHHTIVGMLLALAGVIGLWGIGFFSPDLTRSVFRKSYEAQGLSDSDIKSKLNYLASIVFLVQNIGAFFGIYAFSKVTHQLGRRPTFAIFFVLAMLFDRLHLRLCRQDLRLLGRLLDDPGHGLLPDRPLRRLCDLLPRALPDAFAEYWHIVLLQRRAPGRGPRIDGAQAARNPGVRWLFRASTIRWHRDVRRLPNRADRSPVCPGDQGSAASGVMAGSVPGLTTWSGTFPGWRSRTTNLQDRASLFRSRQRTCGINVSLPAAADWQAHEQSVTRE